MAFLLLGPRYSIKLWFLVHVIVAGGLELTSHERRITEPSATETFCGGVAIIGSVMVKEKNCDLI